MTVAVETISDANISVKDKLPNSSGPASIWTYSSAKISASWLNMPLIIPKNAIPMK